MKQVTKSLFVFLTLFVALLAMAKTKRYEVVLATAVEAGGRQLQAGTYQLEVEGGTAIFYQKNKEICKVVVKTEEVAKKIEMTTYETTRDNKLMAIELGNTNTRLTVSQ